MFSSVIQAKLLCGGKFTNQMYPAILRSEKVFNALRRKNYKNIEVKINASGNLTIIYQSSVKVQKNLLLTSIQYFSKILSTESIMQSFLMPQRLLESY